MLRQLGALAAGTMLALCAACGRPAPGPASSPHIVWHDCNEAATRLQCARVGVPLDWRLPQGAQIELAVIRHRASRPNERIGSLFFNWGGPGVAGVPKVRDVALQLDALGRGRFDVVSWDPRGTGDSEPIVCFDNQRSREAFWGINWSIPTTTAEPKTYVPKTIEFVRRCAARNAALLTHVSTADTVRDLDYLRQLVGDAQLNYRGISYGSFVGQTYANVFPRKVRAMILDGVVDPVAFTTSTQESTVKGTADADLVFDRFLSLCQHAGPARCALARHGTAVTRVQGLLARLRRGPIGHLTYGDALLVLWIKLGAPIDWPQLASEFEAAAAGDGEPLERTAGDVKPFLESALDSAVALQCADKNFPPNPHVQAWRDVVGRKCLSMFGQETAKVPYTALTDLPNRSLAS